MLLMLTSPVSPKIMQQKSYWRNNANNEANAIQVMQPEILCSARNSHGKKESDT